MCITYVCWKSSYCILKTLHVSIQLYHCKTYFVRAVSYKSKIFMKMTICCLAASLRSYLACLLVSRLPVCPSVCQYVCLSVHPSVCPSAHLPICPSAHLPICPSRYSHAQSLICSFVRLSVHPTVNSGNTKGGSITVLLTSCLTGLESAVWQLTVFVFICETD